MTRFFARNTIGLGFYVVEIEVKSSVLETVLQQFMIELENADQISEKPLESDYLF